MGNLCASGPDRFDQKEERRLPENARQGENETLLPKGDVEIGTGSVDDQFRSDVGVSGVKADGLFSEAVKPVVSVLCEGDEPFQEGGQQVGNQGQQVANKSHVATEGQQGAYKGQKVANQSQQVVAEGQQVADQRIQAAAQNKQVEPQGQQVATQRQQVATQDPQVTYQGQQVTTQDGHVTAKCYSAAPEAMVNVKRNGDVDYAADERAGACVNTIREAPNMSAANDGSEDDVRRQERCIQRSSQEVKEHDDKEKTNKDLNHYNLVSSSLPSQSQRFCDGPNGSIEPQVISSSVVSQVSTEPNLSGESRENGREQIGSFLKDIGKTRTSDTNLVEQNGVDGLENAAERLACVELANQETKAREIVESIVEKATVFMSDSQNEIITKRSQMDDIIVERGAKLRAVNFVSSEILNSCSPSSSLTELPPSTPYPSFQPAILVVSDSSSSSVSQADLEDSEEILMNPMSPDGCSVDESNNSILINKAEEDEKRIQRIALEIITKAIQDAIKIIKEYTISPDANLNKFPINNIEACSPSSYGPIEEAIPFTDSTHEEKGRPDLNNGSSHSSSVPESLTFSEAELHSQDLARKLDQKLTELNNYMKSASKVNRPNVKYQASSKYETLEHDYSAETVTSSIDNYNVQSSYSVDDQHDSSSNNVPLIFPQPSTVSSVDHPIDELSPCLDKPVIVILSPDSPPRTNDCSEDELSIHADETFN